MSNRFIVAAITLGCNMLVYVITLYCLCREPSAFAVSCRMVPLIPLVIGSQVAAAKSGADLFVCSVSLLVSLTAFTCPVVALVQYRRRCPHYCAHVALLAYWLLSIGLAEVLK